MYMYAFFFRAIAAPRPIFGMAASSPIAFPASGSTFSS